MARGLLYADAAGDEATGEAGSTACDGGSPNRLRMLSSSDEVLISTSFRREERNEGGSSFVFVEVVTGDWAARAGETEEWLALAATGAWSKRPCRDEGRDVGLDVDEGRDVDGLLVRTRSVGVAGVAAEVGGLDEDATPSLGAPIRRVRGRFNLRSCSWGCSIGDPVCERDLRFRGFGVATATVSHSIARSKSPHARRSCCDCWTAATMARGFDEDDCEGPP